MELEQKIRLFIEILQTQLNEDDSEDIYINDRTIEENFGGILWDAICPALEKRGILTWYSNPNLESSTFNVFALSHPEYWSASQSITGNPAKVKAELRREYRHHFVVNGEKLLSSKPDKKSMTFDERKTITFKDVRHVFHSDGGEKGLPLQFFKMLWKNRSEIKSGKQSKKGELRAEFYYAAQLNLADDSHVYEKSRDPRVSNLIKGLNRVFRDKKFPARVNASGGVLLEIKNP